MIFQSPPPIQRETFLLCRKGTLTGTLKGEVFEASMELVFSEVLVPEMLRLRGDLSAGTSKEEKKKKVNGRRGVENNQVLCSTGQTPQQSFKCTTKLLNYSHLFFYVLFNY